MTSTSTHPQPTLLGIPYEIRSQIYSYIRATEIDSTVITNFKHEHGDSGFHAVPVRSANARVQLPWLSLQLTCRAIASEIASDLGSSTHGRYELSMTTLGARANLGAVRWRRVPCAPAQVDVLDVSLHFEPTQTFWGNGGPKGVVSSLYQTLNLFLHCGPLLDPRRPLEQPVKLTELVVRCQSYTAWSHGLYLDREIRSLIERLCGTGLLYGLVETIVLRGPKHRSKRYSVDYVENAGVPRLWDRYGFEWGVK